ncbi:hypothetical protein AXK56_16675 [Tsukamurella pulmonis]|uniref:Uncharacterized protein n=1 Tax=Tsukamurella pulmonis TaxID=47312 RepID=A0A1H1ABF4_9ACTN|nr:hypothetical protein [Tsukamurella pulmonis]KXO95844.1 hypothetical protein AXK56_16675 [Tsukamurella pulmonis]SDQ36992.1 hypothetical protein SAMN04489765_0144 [Tsukamurella pulmonis]SUQ39393.1 Uncharacterised protein [Tsukamurella pulmonis]
MTEAGRLDETPATLRDDRPRWQVWTETIFRVALVIVGVPAVWILRSMGIVDMAAWHAVVASVVLVVVAVLGPHVVPASI